MAAKQPPKKDRKELEELAREYENMSKKQGSDSKEREKKQGSDSKEREKKQGSDSKERENKRSSESKERHELIKLEKYYLAFEGNADLAPLKNNVPEPMNLFLFVRKPSETPKGSLTPVVPFDLHIYDNGVKAPNSDVTIRLDKLPEEFLKDYIQVAAPKYGVVKPPSDKDKPRLNHYVRLLKRISEIAKAAKAHRWGIYGALTGASILTAGAIGMVTLPLLSPYVAYISIAVGGFGGYEVGGWCGRKIHAAGGLKRFICCITEKTPLLKNYRFFIKSKWDADEPAEQIPANSVILVKKQKKDLTGPGVKDVYTAYIYKKGRETNNSRAEIEFGDNLSIWAKRILRAENLDESGSIEITATSKHTIAEKNKLLKLINNLAEPVAREKYEKRGQIAGVVVLVPLAGASFVVVSNGLTIFVTGLTGFFEGVIRGYKATSEFFKFGAFAGVKETIKKCCVGCAKSIGRCCRNTKHCVNDCCAAIGNCFCSCGRGLKNGIASCCSGIKEKIGGCFNSCATACGGCLTGTKNKVGNCLSSCGRGISNFFAACWNKLPCCRTRVAPVPAGGAGQARAAGARRTTQRGSVPSVGMGAGPRRGSIANEGPADRVITIHSPQSATLSPSPVLLSPSAPQANRRTASVGGVPQHVIDMPGVANSSPSNSLIAHQKTSSIASNSFSPKSSNSDTPPKTPPKPNRPLEQTGRPESKAAAAKKEQAKKAAPKQKPKKGMHANKVRV